LEIRDVHAVANSLIENVSKVIVGKEDVVSLALAAIFSDGHVLLEDVPGVGKTYLAKSLARSLGCDFTRIQFTPDLLPSDVTGVSVYNQKTQEFEFRPGPVMTQVLLADEINRATPRTQAALLEAMQERQITVDGKTYPLPRPFFVLATQNPIELEGTFLLPEAQIDRFLMRLSIGYPDEDDELRILDRFQMEDPLESLEPVTDPATILEVQETVRRVMVEESVRDYIVRVARSTRENPAVALGVSPRGTLALFRTSQALAAIRGRDFVIPDDVKALVPHVLIHRIHISPQIRLRGRTPEQVVSDLVDEVPVPVVE
jgi:MoxR-like ATPase